MVKCSYSGDEIKPGTGKMYVKDNGKVLWFKNSKCEKNMLKLKRDPRKFEWTEAAKIRAESTKKDVVKKEAKPSSKKKDS